MKNELLTAEEVANLLKLSKYTIYEMIKRGEIPSQKIGRRIRVEKKHIMQYLSDEVEDTTPLMKSLHHPFEPLIFVGSNDPALELLFDLIKNKLTIFPSYVGSMNGLLSLYFNKSDFAGSHLFDQETGTYNVPYIKKIFPGETIYLMSFIKRRLGFVTPKDNPKGITGWEALGNSKLAFVNRQKGSGTRVLLDYFLKKYDIDPNEVDGYKDEVMTHSQAAQRVASGLADYALVTAAVAKQWDLSFIPLHDETYQWAMRPSFLETNQFRILQSYLQDENIRTKIKEQTGYDTSEMGEIIEKVEG